MPDGNDPPDRRVHPAPPGHHTGRPAPFEALGELLHLLGRGLGELHPGAEVLAEELAHQVERFEVLAEELAHQVERFELLHLLGRGLGELHPGAEVLEPLPPPPPPRTYQAPGGSWWG